MWLNVGVNCPNVIVVKIRNHFSCFGKLRRNHLQRMARSIWLVSTATHYWEKPSIWNGVNTMWILPNRSILIWVKRRQVVELTLTHYLALKFNTLKVRPIVKAAFVYLSKKMTFNNLQFTYFLSCKLSYV